MTDFKHSLHQLAQTIAKKAQQDTTSLSDQLDAFKALTTYYAAMAKQRGKAGDEPDESDGPSLADLASQLHVTEPMNGGNPSVRGRRRPS